MTEKEIAEYLLRINDIKRKMDALLEKHDKLLSSDKLLEVKEWFINNYGESIGADLYHLLVYAGFHINMKNFVDCKPGYIYYLWFDYNEYDDVNAKLGYEKVNAFDFSDKICFILHDWPNVEYPISCYVEDEFKVIQIGAFHFYYFYSKNKIDYLDEVKDAFKNYIGIVAEEAINAGRNASDFEGIEDVKYVIDTVDEYTYSNEED